LQSRSQHTLTVCARSHGAWKIALLRTVTHGAGTSKRIAVRLNVATITALRLASWKIALLRTVTHGAGTSKRIAVRGKVAIITALRLALIGTSIGEKIARQALPWSASTILNVVTECSALVYIGPAIHGGVAFTIFSIVNTIAIARGNVVESSRRNEHSTVPVDCTAIRTVTSRTIVSKDTVLNSVRVAGNVYRSSAPTGISIVKGEPVQLNIAA
jgi:hypothetical protein